jgi:hypothetical protein
MVHSVRAISKMHKGLVGHDAQDLAGGHGSGCWRSNAFLSHRRKEAKAHHQAGPGNGKERKKGTPNGLEGQQSDTEG